MVRMTALVRRPGLRGMNRVSHLLAVEKRRDEVADLIVADRGQQHRSQPEPARADADVGRAAADVGVEAADVGDRHGRSRGRRDRCCCAPSRARRRSRGDGRRSGSSGVSAARACVRAHAGAQPHDSRTRSALLSRDRCARGRLPSRCRSISRLRRRRAELALRQIDRRQPRRERVQPRIVVAGDDARRPPGSAAVLPQRLHEADRSSGSSR